MSRSRLLALALLAEALATGCRTRPWELPGVDAADATDAAVPDLAAPRDLAIADLTILRDLAIPDLVRLPDLTPPPDLTLPYVCRETWVVDSGRMLSYFNTQTATFTDVRFLPRADVANPQTMSVRRDGFAFVIYNNGDILRVKLDDGTVSGTGFNRFQIAQAGQFLQAGSAFSADQPGGEAETLFIQITGEQKLATIDTKTWRVNRFADLPYTAELTGTGDAELWGFFPSEDTFIARIDKVTAALDKKITVPQIKAASSGAYAFAHWGGDFWIFHENTGQGETTNVYKVNRMTGDVSVVLRNTGRHIVGAGASSCAPIGLDQ